MDARQDLRRCPLFLVQMTMLRVTEEIVDRIAWRLSPVFTPHLAEQSELGHFGKHVWANLNPECEWLRDGEYV